MRCVCYWWSSLGLCHKAADDRWLAVSKYEGRICVRDASLVDLLDIEMAPWDQLPLDTMRVLYLPPWKAYSLEYPAL